MIGTVQRSTKKRGARERSIRESHENQVSNEEINSPVGCTPQEGEEEMVKRKNSKEVLLLQRARIRIREQEKQYVYVTFDSGSQRTFMTEEMNQKLMLMPL